MTETATQKIWPPYVRLIHIGFIGLLPVLWFSAEEGHLDIHQYAGISLMALVGLRVLMGFIGRGHTRFSSFLYSPKTVFKYAKTLFERNSTHYTGHNPMGGYMVMILLGLLFTQGLLGLFSTDDVIFEGPLAGFISYDLSITLTDIHHDLFDFIIIAVALHIAAVLWYQLYKKQPLIQSMVHGRKPYKTDDAN